MTQNGASGLTHHPVVSHEEWLAARTAFLAREKEFTRLRDQLSEERRRLPWEAVTKAYVFEGPSGKRTLGELFEGRSQCSRPRTRRCTSPARSSTFTCFETPLNEMGNRPARLPTLRSPPARAASMARRVGSAMAA